MQYRRLLRIAAVGLTAACTEAGTPTASVGTGTYTLSSIGDRAVPFVVRVISPSRSVALVGGTLTLSGDGTFRATTALYDGQVGVPGSSTSQTADVSGRYQSVGGDVTLSLASGRVVLLSRDVNGRLRGPLVAVPDAALDSAGVALYARDP